MKKLFTLAEVLITLGIIGIVVALTIPGLVKNYQKKVIANKLKVEYTRFYDIFRRTIEDNGSISDWINEFSDTLDQFVKSGLITDKYILPYINGTTHKFGRYEYGTVFTLRNDGATVHTIYNSGAAYKMMNGTIFKISYNSSSQDAVLLLDIDNKSDKNILGKDVFIFIISPTDNVLKAPSFYLSRDVLIGNDGDRACFPPECPGGMHLNKVYSCRKTAGSQYNHYTGLWCSSLIMKDGWEIKPDYPW